ALKLVPSISHSAIRPLVIQIRSVLPSPSRSPVPTVVQPAGYGRMYVLVKLLPLPTHIHMLAPSVQMTSILPSPSKSPMATNLYFADTGVAAVFPSCAPFISQYANCALFFARHMRSDLPSPSTSLLT